MSTECKRRKHAHTQSSCDTTSEQLWEQVWEARPNMEAPPPHRSLQVSSSTLVERLIGGGDFVPYYAR